MYVHPCRHCSRCRECKQYQAILKAGRESPLKMTSCRIKCEGFPESIFPPGTRVQAAINIIEGDGDYSVSYDALENGTVMRASSKRDKLLVHIDCLEGEPNAIRHLYPSKLTLLDEPPVELCPGCSLPIDIATRPKKDWCCECDVKPSERIKHFYDGHGVAFIPIDDWYKWRVSLPYPCQTIAMIVEDL